MLLLGFSIWDFMCIYTACFTLLLPHNFASLDEHQPAMQCSEGIGWGVRTARIADSRKGGLT